MSLENILIKSDENYQTGVWAENQKYYDVAVSRFYYTLYQKIIYIINTYKTDKIETRCNKSNNKNSHKDTISLFIEIVDSNLTDREIAIISNIQRFRIRRNDAEYKDNRILTLDNYRKIFKDDFEKVLEVMNKLLEEENHEEDN